jgi:hypothetical protein
MYRPGVCHSTLDAGRTDKIDSTVFASSLLTNEATLSRRSVLANSTAWTP